MKFRELVNKLGCEAIASSLEKNNGMAPDITGVAPVDEAVVGTLSYIEGAKFASYLGTTNASALILPMDETLQTQASERGIEWVAGKEPRLLFAKAIALFYQPFQPIREIHGTAVIHSTAKIGKNVYLGPHVVVDAGVKIGDNVCIYPNVVIYPDVEIGDNSVLHANCSIHERSQIGNSCVIHSGAVIGGEGFGFVPTQDGWYKMEQSGRVVLEDGVEVGGNTTIDRPAVGETRIGKNTKLDNLVQVGHGCQIGKNCALAAQVGLAGGVKLGDHVILAGQVGIANQAKIGDGAIATAQAGVHNDVAAGEIVSSSPAVPYKIYLKASAIYKRLPEIYQYVKQIKRMLNISSK
ncbi:MULTISPECIES: UDP-3-O-(3-hydroxymyristoyl)glucosamine N-acyltransferase [Okeania]|uniref:UDP-3-O-acylglucosamine N-acyltransferase n=1 Tax=Okeania hirsuta TaxID=1458930 RepID=A0A3N6P0I5_9CYAN|nr:MULTISPECIES: UDP-3-O-(3-hydroxymyristoyl)glucosamine N-acyltransferase [Okeania]NET16283.1 UDP-3-O-(3-hydroxymyristoyl)glucosamine N-acyltransferase [Okeania sp. SIO1H6]NES79572.1 UDP-3-O-(3-hydroxymyristoyl)glucosamine N-acyltransferase [Okeania sp. SIO1H4]NET23243.1 UDP-3-O-(3-hydroxymyristoyl)glucosamine N-acyltransferase [Okeania sp. SIO1H5]NET79878.1 UDP-3-O-(3-hydroxymyristoyl)glucosamine N-acyltransferase [Okeania sp. SIO1F9]NET96987.1 UDP-3-O-(3-hydroxymyristoyl)glucosamine N-acylt